MLRLLTLVLAVGLSLTAYAEGAEGVVAGPSTQYIYFEPALVVNYGSTGRMKFLRTDVALRVSSVDSAAKVSHHKPYIRNNLVMLFSGQESEVMNTPQGREELRQKALEEVNALMTELEGAPAVDDLYFNNFVVQN